MDLEQTALIHRLVVAVEQIALELASSNAITAVPAPASTYTLPTPAPSMPRTPDPTDYYKPLEWRCPEHLSSRIVPAGVSGKTGKPYAAFLVCGEQRCDQKPPRVQAPARVLPQGGMLP